MKNLLFICITLFAISSVKMTAQEKAPLDILAFSKTEGYRHGAIPQSLVTLGEMAEQNQWHVRATEDSLMISDEVLSNIDVVVFVHTTGNLLGKEQQKALKDFIMKGGGLVTLHSGTITENDWSWFVDAVGGIFVGHPPSQEGKLSIEDRNHPATEHFPDSTWTTTDEWYSFDRNPREDVRVLISIDENSYDVDDDRWFEGAEQRMDDHPLVWCQSLGQGRVFQTALGHEPELYEDPLFLKHLKGGILWSSGLD
ncbi:MAG: ThuA domain-containing protein [Bacteroidota bacterium]